jgi:quinol monooxygenase YgiN
MKKVFLIPTILFTIVAISCKPKATTPAEAKVVEGVQIEVQKMITAKVFIKQGMEADFAEAAKWMIDTTLTEEGCLQYTLYQDPYNPANFFFFERYKNQEAVDKHFAAPYFSEFGNKIGDMTSKPAEIQVWDIFPNK